MIFTLLTQCLLAKDNSWERNSWEFCPRIYSLTLKVDRLITYFPYTLFTHLNTRKLYDSSENRLQTIVKCLFVKRYYRFRYSRLKHRRLPLKDSWKLINVNNDDERWWGTMHCSSLGGMIDNIADTKSRGTVECTHIYTHTYTRHRFTAERVAAKRANRSRAIDNGRGMRVKFSIRLIIWVTRILWLTADKGVYYPCHGKNRFRCWS